MLAALVASPAHAQLCNALQPGPTGRVVAISDGDTLDLDSGLTVRLVGIQAPKLPLGREGFVAWPLGDAARDLLVDLAQGQTVTLYYGEERRDRHGRALAHVMINTDEGTIWAQQAMLEAGLARVYSFPDNRLCLPDLLAAEARGRAERLGIWRDPYYAIRDATRPDILLGRIGDYELVEGRVLNAERARNRVYLNFGRHWKEDFTVIVENAALGLFDAEDFDLLALDNAVIRVRGWIDELDGPRILVTHPEQIEILVAQ